MRILVAVAGLVLVAGTAGAQPGGAPMPPPPPEQEPMPPPEQAPMPRPPPPPPYPDMRPMPPQPPPPAPPAPRTFSLTISPIHLALPIVELTGEYRVSRDLGFALVGGLGNLKGSAGGAEEKFFAAEAGGSVRYYPMAADFEGLQLGAEALYVYVKLESNNGSFEGSAFADGLSVGPFVGYKYMGGSGFTFDGQLGVAYAAARAKASDGSTTATNTADNVFPLLNLNVGYSF